ncbi:hypothetical protein BR63_03470 [Thermanaerosceptrum fracticalcis]|jgi:hypothetical protein|uniref:Zinc-ribbon domain-containing protein n=1 Tax=Thermanaerosceptrum fracticalcis TaxID=1712410 RepID=A0A7G6E056_THEFR|nr:zinc-ribbon domain-containing protein [Thermanaerosceptrum fracticalcis]QNB45460.1 hypothetical protein BR63_03470 [Thermanaerosceptrum fracticalcis]
MMVMKEKEAIASLKNIIEYWTYRPTEVEAAKAAIKALEKQIPQKVLELHGDGGFCPVCHMHNLDVFKYCTRCGQKLEWE